MESRPRQKSKSDQVLDNILGGNTDTQTPAIEKKSPTSKSDEVLDRILSGNVKKKDGGQDFSNGSDQSVTNASESTSLTQDTKPSTTKSERPTPFNSLTLSSQQFQDNIDNGQYKPIEEPKAPKPKVSSTEFLVRDIADHSPNVLEGIVKNTQAAFTNIPDKMSEFDKQEISKRVRQNVFSTPSAMADYTKARVDKLRDEIQNLETQKLKFETIDSEQGVKFVTNQAAYDKNNQKIADRQAYINTLKNSVAEIASDRVLSQTDLSSFNPKDIGRKIVAIADPELDAQFKLAENGGNLPAVRKTQLESLGLNAAKQYLAKYPNTPNAKQASAFVRDMESDFDERNVDATAARVRTKLGDYLYKDGKSGWLGYSQETLQQAINDPKSGLTPSERKIAETVVLPTEKRIWGTDIPGSGFARGFRNAVEKSAEGTVKSALDITGLRSESDIANENLSQPANTRYQNVNNRTGFDKWRDGVADLTGQVAMMALTTKGVGALGKALTASGEAGGLLGGMTRTFAGQTLANENVGLFLNSYLNSYDNYKQQATQLMSGEGQAEGREMYAKSMAFIEGLSEKIFNDTKVLKAFTGNVSPVVKDITQRYLNNEITSAVAKDEMRGAISKYARTAGKEFGKSTVEESFEEGIVDVADGAAQSIFGGTPFDVAKTGKQALNTFVTTAINSPLVAGLAAHGAVRQNNAQNAFMKAAIGQVAANPGEYLQHVDNLAETGQITTNEANEKRKIISSASNALKEMPESRFVPNTQGDELADVRKSAESSNRTIRDIHENYVVQYKNDGAIIKFTPEETNAYILHRLNEQIIENKLEKTTDPVLASALKKDLKRSVDIRRGIFDGSITVNEDLQEVAPDEKKAEDLNIINPEAPIVKGTPEEISQPIELSPSETKIVKSGEISKPIELNPNGETNFSQTENINQNESEKTENAKTEGQTENVLSAETLSEMPPVTVPESTPEQPQPYALVNNDTKEFVTKSKNQKVVREGNQLSVLNIKDDSPATPKMQRKALKEYSENYDYTVGEKAPEPDSNAGFKNEGELKSAMVEQSNHPAELAAIYLDEAPNVPVLSFKEQAIAEMGIATKEKSYNDFGDRNVSESASRLAYFSKTGRSLDAEAKSISDHYDIEVTPQDLVDFMNRFPNGAYSATKEGESDVASQAATKFKELTGLTLDRSIAERAVEQDFSKLDYINQSLLNDAYDNEQHFADSYAETFKEPAAVTGESKSKVSTPNGQVGQENNGVKPSGKIGEQVKHIADRVKTYGEPEDMKGYHPDTIMHFNQGINNNKVVLIVDPAIKSDYSERSRRYKKLSGDNSTSGFKDVLKDVAKNYRLAEGRDRIIDLRGIDLSTPLENIIKHIEGAENIIKVGEQGKPTITEAGKSLADKLRQLKSKPNTANANIFGLAIGVYDGVIETIATAIENGAKLADAIKTGLDSLSKEDRGKVDENAFIQHIEDFSEGKKPKIKVTTTEEETTHVNTTNQSSITHAATEQMREDVGIDEKYNKQVITDRELNEQADAEIKKGYDFEKLITSLENGHNPTSLETTLLKKYKNSLQSEIDKNPTPENIAKADRFTKASDFARSDIARSLRGGRDLDFDEESLAGFLEKQKIANEGATITAAQIKINEEEYKKLTAANKALQDKIDKLKKEAKEKKATDAIKKTTPKTKKTHEDFVKERKDILADIKAKLKEARGDTTATIVPYAKELFAIAPDVAKLTRSLVEEGVSKLSDLVDKVHENLVDAIPEITKDDVMDLIAGDYNENKQTKNKIAEILYDVRTQAKLINRLNDLENGEVPTNPQKLKRHNQEIEDLRKKIKEHNLTQLTELKTNAEKQIKNLEEKIRTGAFSSLPKQTKIRLDQEAIDLQNRVKELQTEIADKKTVADLKEKLSKLQAGEEPKNDKEKNVRSKDIEDLKTAIKKHDLTRLAATKKSVQSQIEKLEEQLRTGNFETPESKELKLDKEALDLKDKLIKLRIERETRLAKEKYAKRGTRERIGDLVVDVLNVPRTAMSSIDFSAVLRQAVIPTIAHPALAGRAAIEMFRQSVSQQRFDRWFYDLKDSSRYKLMQMSGLYVADPHDTRLSAKEESFMNNLAEKIPFIGGEVKFTGDVKIPFTNKVIGNLGTKGIKVPFTDKYIQGAGGLIKGSERAYVGYLNKMRVDLFNRISDGLESAGMTYENNEDVYKALGSFVNNVTGRGNLGPVERAAPLLNSVFFAPRYFSSIVNTLGISDIALSLSEEGGYYTKMPPVIRKQAIHDLLTFVGTGLSILAALGFYSLAFPPDDEKDKIKIELDPRSSEFGKIKKGNTLWNIFSSYPTLIRYIAQLITGEAKNRKTGKIQELNTSDYNRGTVAGSFLRSKLAPIPSMLIDLGLGKNAIGEKVTGQDELQQHLSPLFLQDLGDAVDQGGYKSLVTVGVPSMFGVGVQTYKPRNFGGIDYTKDKTYNFLYKNNVNLPNPTEQGTMTDKEFKDFVPTKQKLVKQNWEEIISNGALMTEDGKPTVNSDKAVVIKPADKLSEEELAELMSAVSSHATREAKKELNIETKKK